MYPAKPGLIIGFHGCDKQLRDEVVMGRTILSPSKNTYDWLGAGVYFWENNQQRALHFAKERKNSPIQGKERISTPAVLGAVIDMGFCLDLLDSEFLELAKQSYHTLADSYKILGLPLPENKKGKDTNDLLVRNLDCKVIENLHLRWEENKANRLFDSARGVFIEGEPLYPNAGFNEKNHIQICIRNPNCIKGFFIPRYVDDDYVIP